VGESIAHIPGTWKRFLDPDSGKFSLFLVNNSVKNAPQQDQFRIISLCFELFCILARKLCSLFHSVISFLSLFVSITLRRMVFCIASLLFLRRFVYRALRCYRIVFLWKGLWCNGCKLCAGCCSISSLRFLYCATLIYFFPVLLPAFCKVKGLESFFL
jgi:hypothetical protein